MNKSKELSIFGLGEKLCGLISIIFFTLSFQLDKIDSTLLLFTPKENFFELQDPKNLEMVTRVFFSQRRKMLKKPFNQVFTNGKQVAEKFGIDLNLRPQNLEPEIYFKLVKDRKSVV